MKIVILDGYSLSDSDITPITSLGDCTIYENSTQQQVVERCSDADVIITNKVKVFASEMDALPNLKLICVAATGTNNVDMEYASQRGIEVRNVPAYSTQSVTEATFSLALALLRNTIYYDRYVHSGQYANSGRTFNLDRSISQINGKRWGIIGMGNIGRSVARLATAFGAEVCYYSTSGKNNDAGYEQVSLDTLLTSCDIVSIHAPLNVVTQSLIGYTELAKMRCTAILINVGRGGIVVEADLARALNEELIAGAALDVFTSEPIEQNNPLLKLNDPLRLVTAPHSAWSSVEARDLLIETIARNITTFFEQ